MSWLLTRFASIPLPIRGLLALVPATIALGLGLHIRDLNNELASPLAATPPLRFCEALAMQPIPGQADLDLTGVRVPQPVQLVRGQTLSGLLNELGLAPEEAWAATAALAEHIDLRKVRAGDACLAYFDPPARLAGLRLSRGNDGWVELQRSGETWTTVLHDYARRTVVRSAAGELVDVLERAVRKAGADSQLAYRMSDVLQWDLDFNRDLRVGDRFQVLFEETYLDGRFAGLGAIEAVVYESRGRRYEAYRFGEKGYYDAEGRPVQKLFLRSPLPFTRVTSRFSHRRFHPVLKVYRPHYGVDYGAPTGTPVRVTAHGTVVFAARSGGGGKMIKVRHPHGYVTAYLHLSGYAKGLRKGSRVRQGEVIGYVGSTGLSTGPHLDYRVQRNGSWIDPLKLKGERADPIPEHELPAFLQARDALRSRLAHAELPQHEIASTARPSVSGIMAR